MNGDLNLTNFDNQQLGQTNIANTYLREKNIDVYDRFGGNMPNTDDKINTIIDDYKPKTDDDDDGDDDDELFLWYG